jgi:hypothetical protein
VGNLIKYTAGYIWAMRESVKKELNRLEIDSPEKFKVIVDIYRRNPEKIILVAERLNRKECAKYICDALDSYLTKIESL